MGGTQRMAAVAAVAHSRHYYNHTAPEVRPTDASPNNINFIFASATLCGVLVMVCAACWRRKPSYSKPVDVSECRGVYTVSADSRLNQIQNIDLPAGPPPAYETVVESPTDHNKDCLTLEEVVTEPRLPRHTPERRDSELPSYEAAVLLKDTKL